MKKKKTLILLDLDGVIIDSRKNMELSWSTVQTVFQIDIPFKNYFKLIGRPFNDVIDILGLTDYGDKIKKVYDVASASRQDLVKFFDECIELLKEFKKDGLKIGIVTSKTAERTEKIVQTMGVDFNVVECPNDKSRGKPNPDPLLKAMFKCGKDPIETIYIGDMPVDCEAACRAKIDYIHANWGYGNCKEKVNIANRPNDIKRFI